MRNLLIFFAGKFFYGIRVQCGIKTQKVLKAYYDISIMSHLLWRHKTKLLIFFYCYAGYMQKLLKKVFIKGKSKKWHDK